jgi:hypothetical protein
MSVFGGYATLAGVAFSPDLYSVAVAIVPPSDLVLLLHSIPPYWESTRKIMYSRMAVCEQRTYIGESAQDVPLPTEPYDCNRSLIGVRIGMDLFPGNVVLVENFH